MLHGLLLVAASWEVTEIRRVDTAQSVWQWQQQGGCVPWGVQEHQQVVFRYSALLCGALEVNGAANGFCSQTVSGAKPLPPLEPEITVVVCPCLL